MNALYLKQLLIVGAGGFVGSALRYAVSGWSEDLAFYGQFPYATFIVNIVGCFLIGGVGGYTEFRHGIDPALRLFLMVGVLGGFTTFSAYAFETLGLFRDGDVLKALLNVTLQVILGTGAAVAAYFGARSILS